MGEQVMVDRGAMEGLEMVPTVEMEEKEVMEQLASISMVVAS